MSMRLAEFAVLVDDLRMLVGSQLTNFYMSDYYPNNALDRRLVFPLLRKDQPLHPVLNHIGRWGNHLLLVFQSCTFVIKVPDCHSLIVSASEYPQIKIVDVACMFELSKAERQVCLMFLDSSTNNGYVSVYGVGQVPSEFSVLGLDLLDMGFTKDYLVSEIHMRQTLDGGVLVAELLTNPQVVAWIDSPMLSEILFLSGIYPFRSVSSLIPLEISALYQSIRISSYRAKETLKNSFVSTAKIDLQVLDSVYGRSSCPVCGTGIKIRQLDSHVIHWCPACQPPKASVCQTA